VKCKQKDDIVTYNPNSDYISNAAYYNNSVEHVPGVPDVIL